MFIFNLFHESLLINYSVNQLYNPEQNNLNINNILPNNVLSGFNPFQPQSFAPFMQYQRAPNYQQPPSPDNFNSNSYMNHHRSVSVDSAFLSKQPSNNTLPVFSDDTNIKLEEYSTPLCRYFAAGYCNRGDRCSFSHDRRDDSKKEPKDKLSKIIKAKANQKGLNFIHSSSFLLTLLT